MWPFGAFFTDEFHDRGAYPAPSALKQPVCDDEELRRRMKHTVLMIQLNSISRRCSSVISSWVRVQSAIRLHQIPTRTSEEGEEGETQEDSDSSTRMSKGDVNSSSSVYFYHYFPLVYVNNSGVQLLMFTEKEMTFLNIKITNTC